jgi:hypothetical protein
LFGRSGWGGIVIRANGNEADTKSDRANCEKPLENLHDVFYAKFPPEATAFPVPGNNFSHRLGSG